MKRSRNAALVGVLALALGVALALLAGVTMMPSYLAAWLFFVAIPVGALPVVMALELAGAGLSPLAAALRRLLVLLPVAALFVIPVLLRLGTLYRWNAPVPHGFAAAWFSPGFFIARTILYLLIWVALALAFLRPRAAARGGTALALLLHVVVGTLAATDWAMSLDLGFGSAGFGLLFLVAQSGIAVSVAALFTGGGRRTALAPAFATLILVLLGAWVFLHFVQFLVVWSADLPREIVWYRQRTAGLGEAAEIFGFAAFVLPLVLLLPRSLARRPGVVAAMALLVLLAHLVEMLWLVTPSFRGHFSLLLPDALAILGLGGLTLAALFAFAPTVTAGQSHDAV